MKITAPEPAIDSVMPAPWSTCDARRRACVTHVMFDVDDTLTWRGALPEEATRALYAAARAGLSLVAVTGRSAAWAELLLRLFPLEAAIAETGAVCLWKDDDRRVRVLHAEPDEDARRRNDARRRGAVARVLAEVPAARLALDNAGRLYDVAFDLVEDGPPIDAATASRIRALLEEEGLTTAQSSVHINAWIGHFDKATMVERYCRECCGRPAGDVLDTTVYVGDSPNDGPLFRRVPLSVGVANVRPHLPVLVARRQAPRFIVDEEGGLGFALLVASLLDERP